MNETDLLGRPNSNFQTNTYSAYQSYPAETMSTMILNPFVQAKPENALQNQSNPMLAQYLSQPSYATHNTADSSLSQAGKQLPHFMKFKQSHSIPMEAKNPGLVADLLKEKITRMDTPNVASAGGTSHSGEGFLKEFQSKLVGLLATQSQILGEIKERNDVLQDSISSLMTEINVLK